MDFFFMMSLLLPNRVDEGIKAVLRSRIDKWEKGKFCDEMVEGMMKPYINPCLEENST